MKKFLIMAVLAAVLVPSTVLASSIGVTINNIPVNFTEQTGIPFIDDTNRTLVPMRIVMEQYGCSVSWEQSTKTATITKDGIIVQVPIGASYIIVNGTQVVNDAPAQIIDGKTYLPIRAVLEAVGASVEWDGESKSVVVNGDVVKPNNIAANEPTAQKIESNQQQLAIVFKVDGKNYTPRNKVIAIQRDNDFYVSFRLANLILNFYQNDYNLKENIIEPNGNTNITVSPHDGLVDESAGIKYMPTEKIQIDGYILIPIQDCMDKFNITGDLQMYNNTLIID